MTRLAELQSQYSTVGGQLSFAETGNFDLQVAAYDHGSAAPFAPPLSQFVLDYLKGAFVSALRADRDRLEQELKAELENVIVPITEATPVTDLPQPPTPEVPAETEASPVQGASEAPVEVAASPAAEAAVEAPVGPAAEPVADEAPVSAEVSASEAPQDPQPAAPEQPAVEEPVSAPVSASAEPAPAAPEAPVEQAPSVDSVAAENARIAAKAGAVKQASDALVAEIADPTS